MILVNFKTYEQATDKRAVLLAKTCERVSRMVGVFIIPVVQMADLYRVSQNMKIPLFTQHLDPHAPGAHTGADTVETAIKAGASGTLLNHSERPLDMSVLDATIKRIRSVQADFKIVVCVSDIEKLKYAETLKPDFLAYEPPDLIGSTTTSVAQEKEDAIENSVKHAREIPLIVGAGVKSAEDVTVSTARGAHGILVASAVVKAENSEGKLMELAKAFRNG